MISKEDFVLRQIDKIGKVIEAILTRLRIISPSQIVSPYEIAREELSEKLGIDISALDTAQHTAAMLVDKYGFSQHNLEQFASLLFEILSLSNDINQKKDLAEQIVEIYIYLDRSQAPYSLDRYHILYALKDFMTEGS